MKARYRDFEGAQLVNIVTSFLKKRGIDIPRQLKPGEDLLLYTSEDGKLKFSYVCVKWNNGYYKILEDGILTKTNEFYYIRTM